MPAGKRRSLLPEDRSPLPKRTQTHDPHSSPTEAKGQECLLAQQILASFEIPTKELYQESHLILDTFAKLRKDGDLSGEEAFSQIYRNL